MDVLGTQSDVAINDEVGIEQEHRVLSLLGRNSPRKYKRRTSMEAS